MKYHLIEGAEAAQHLILLHGTGGDEYSLVELANYLAPGSTILSLRGRVQEEGMNRFFKRNGLNQFDFESLAEETQHLLETIAYHSQQLDVPLDKWTLVGYSNGANIAAHMLLEKETELRKGILFHPMSLGKHQQTFDVGNKQVWLSYGEGDPIVSKAAFTDLTNAFVECQSNPEIYLSDSGHQLTMAEAAAAKAWLENQ